MIFKEIDEEVDALRDKFLIKLKSELGIVDIRVTSGHEDEYIDSINGFPCQNPPEDCFSDNIPDGLIEDMAERSGKSKQELTKGLVELDLCCRSLWLLSTRSRNK